jgi:hypothetical protein
MGFEGGARGAEQGAAGPRARTSTTGRSAAV